MKKVLYIDMDGVVADFETKIKASVPELNDPEIWNNTDSRKKLIDDYVAENRHFFLTLQPIPDAIPSIFGLTSYYDVYFLSAPMSAVHESYSDKRSWIDAQFGPYYAKRLILTHRKDLVVGDFLVDDRVAHGAGNFRGKHIHFGTSRFPSWQRVTEYLLDAYKEEPMYSDIFSEVRLFEYSDSRQRMEYMEERLRQGHDLITVTSRSVSYTEQEECRFYWKTRNPPK